MRLPGQALVASLLIAALLAGCTAPASWGGPDGRTLQNGILAGTGIVKGRVVDDLNLPVADAQVAAHDGAVQTVTGPDGQFVLVNVHPGTVTLLVAKLGYLGAAKLVEVQADHELDVLLILLPFLIESPFVDTRGPYTGLLHCGLSTPGIVDTYPSVTYDCGSLLNDMPIDNAQNEFRFDLRSQNFNTIVGETRWDTTMPIANADDLQTLFSHAGGSTTHWWCSGEGKSPLRFVYTLDEGRRECKTTGADENEPVPVGPMTLVLRTYLPFIDPVDPRETPAIPPADAAVMQKYESLATIFYGDDPPQQYSAFQ